MAIHKLSERQIKKIQKIINNNGIPCYIDIPENPINATVKVLQEDNQVIGEITVAQAFHI